MVRDFEVAGTNADILCVDFRNFEQFHICYINFLNNVREVGILLLSRNSGYQMAIWLQYIVILSS
jgi:hypothetical protein